jgi:hypothetical protein
LRLLVTLSLLCIDRCSIEGSRKDGERREGGCKSDVHGLVVLTCARAVVSTLAGGVSGTNGAYADGSGTSTGFRNPAGVAVDASGNVFVADYHNHRIRKVTAGGGTQIGPVILRACSVDMNVDAPA